MGLKGGGGVEWGGGGVELRKGLQAVGDRDKE